MFLRKFPRYLLLLSLIALLLSYTAGLSSTGSVFTDCDSNGPINLVAAWEEAAALACMEMTAITVTGEGGADWIDTPGGTLQMYAGFESAEDLELSVSWSVIGEAAVINETGLLTALADGTVLVVATADDDTGVSGSLEVTITNQGDGKPVEEPEDDENGDPSGNDPGQDPGEGNPGGDTSGGGGDDEGGEGTGTDDGDDSSDPENGSEPGDGIGDGDVPDLAEGER